MSYTFKEDMKSKFLESFASLYDTCHEIGISPPVSIAFDKDGLETLEYLLEDDLKKVTEHISYERERRSVYGVTLERGFL